MFSTVHGAYSIHIIYIYLYSTIYSFIVVGHLGYCFPFLNIVNNCAVTMRVQISLQHSDFVFFGYIPEVELIDGSSVLNFFRDHQTAFHSDYTNLHSHQQCTRKGPFTPYPCQYLSLIFFKNNSHSAKLWF